jgi:hypothetical protein
MKLVPKTAASFQPPRDKLLEGILRRCGAYYHPAELFYQELWRDRLGEIGFYVISVERMPHHPVWEIRLRGSLAAQTYLLVTKPIPKPHACADDLLVPQLKAEIRQIAQGLGKPTKRDCVGVTRSGAYFRVSFLWPLGRPGVLVRQEKRAEPFSFLVRPWLRKNRN